MLRLSLAILLLAFGPLLAGSAARGDGQTDARAVIDKAIKALGGEEKLKARSTIRAQGKLVVTLNNAPISLTFDALLHHHDQLRSDMVQEANNNPAAFIINRDKAWTKIGDSVIEADESIPVMRGVYDSVRLCQTLLPARGPDAKLSLFGEVKEDNRPAVGVTISRKDHPDVLVLFDKETGVPIKSELRIKNRDKKEFTWTVFYDEYKDFDGFKHFSKMRFKIDGLEMPTSAELTISAIAPADAAKDADFAKP
jgi:hypothetical protein